MTVKPLLVAVATFRNDWRSMAAARILFAFISSSETAAGLRMQQLAVGRVTAAVVASVSGGRETGALSSERGGGGGHR